MSTNLLQAIIYPLKFTTRIGNTRLVQRILEQKYMTEKVRKRHKETFFTVGTGLLINYPLNLLGLFICIDMIGMNDTFWIGTTVTAWMTIVAYIRVFMVRSYFDKRH